MKLKIFGLGMLFIFVSLISFDLQSRCIGPTVNGECLGEEVYGEESSEEGYEGNSGQKYQYDLNDPSDTIDYSLDLDAQKRDRNSTSTKKQADEELGEYGGGIYDDK